MTARGCGFNRSMKHIQLVFRPRNGIGQVFDCELLSKISVPVPAITFAESACGVLQHAFNSFFFKMLPTFIPSSENN